MTHIKPTPRDLHFAYLTWQRRFANGDADAAVAPSLDLPDDLITSSLSLARKGLMLSTNEVAKRLNVSRQAYSYLEQSECLGTITLSRLKEAAEAMDCELIYFIRPKSRKLFSEVVWEKLLKEILPRLEKRLHLPHMRGHVLAALADEAMHKPDIRRKLRLSQKQSELLK